MCSVEEFNETFCKFQQIYDTANKLLASGINEEEASNKENALQIYKHTIELIDKAMLIPISFPPVEQQDKDNDINQKIKDLKKIIYNFKMQRSEILLRIGTIFRKKEQEEAENVLKKRKMSTSVIDDASPKLRPRTYNELESVLKNLGKVQHSGESILEILFCCNGVKLYYIESNAEVVSSLEDFVLRIIKLGSDFEKNLEETLFLQLIKSSETFVEIGEEVDENEACAGPSHSENNTYENQEQQADPSFIYPIIPGVSPLFRTNFKAFVIPDLQNNDGSAIGMIIHDAEADALVLDILMTILKGVVKENGEIEFSDFTKIGEESERVKRSTGDKISENIISGAHWISKGLVCSAQKTGEFIDYSTPYILSKVQQAGDSAPPVSNKLNTSVTVAKSLTSYAAQGTSFLAEKVGSSMASFGKFLAPHVQHQGAKLLTYTTGMDNDRSTETMTETLKIASGAAEAISQIYSGLETSANILGSKISDNSVKLVRHKYGESYAAVSEKSFDTVGNLIAVNRSFNILTPKGLVKSTAKNTGKGILNSDEFKPKVYINKDYFTGSTSLIPNLENFAKELKKPNV